MHLNGASELGAQAQFGCSYLSISSCQGKARVCQVLMNQAKPNDKAPFDTDDVELEY